MVRYGLPDNYDLLVDPIPEPVTLSLIKAQPEPSPRPSTNKAFEDAYQNIETCISAFVELTVKEQDSRNEILNSKIGKHDALANANISHLADDFNTRLELQTKQVRDVIRREKNVFGLKKNVSVERKKNVNARKKRNVSARKKRNVNELKRRRNVRNKKNVNGKQKKSVNVNKKKKPKRNKN